MTTAAPFLWLLTDDRPGNAGQVLGVADALGRPFVRKEVRYTALGRLPNIVRGATLVGVSEATAAALTPPWPALVIAAGRRTAPVARWIQRAAAPTARVRLVQLMNPGRAAAAFDLIAVPRHDCAWPEGDAANVLRITGAPHPFSAARLAAEAAAWAPRLAPLPRPFVALLVGGATRQRPFPPDLARDVGAGVAALARRLGGAVLLATSRRTGAAAEAALDEAVAAPRHAYFWGRAAAAGSGAAAPPNPYGGILALADAIVVTGDSVSMCSEACANPNAVYIYAPPGMAAPKHQCLHAELYAKGYARPFDGTHTPFTHPPLNAAAEVAARIVRLLQTDENAL
jgi:mitochondrial fission protein ELM1